MLMLAPIAGALARSPSLGLLGLAGGALTLATGVVVHFLTLPTELDASFVRALPLLHLRAGTPLGGEALIGIDGELLLRRRRRGEGNGKGWDESEKNRAQ